MSHDFRIRKTKQTERPKVHYTQYLYNSGEPEENKDFNISPKHEAELLENNFTIKRRIKRMAQIVRIKYRYSA